MGIGHWGLEYWAFLRTLLLWIFQFQIPIPNLKSPIPNPQPLRYHPSHKPPMSLTFTSLGNEAVQLAGAERPLVFFPEKAAGKETISFFSVPADEPPANTVSWPGEYNMAGVSVRGIGQKEGQQVSYIIETDGIRSAFVAAPFQEWTDHDIEQLGEVDVLVLPNDDAKIAHRLIDELDPRVLMLTADDKGKFDPELLRSCGAAGKEHVKEFKLKGSLQAEGREVVVLEA